MRRVLCAAGLLLVFGCAKKEAVVKQETSTSAAASASSSQQTSSAAAPADASNLLSFYNGALVAVPAQEYGYGQTTFDLIDEDSSTTWAGPEHVVSGLSMVFLFPEKTRVEQLSFDSANVEQDGEGPRDVSVEISDQSATEGFTKIASASLEDKKDKQVVAVTTPGEGRWLRVNIANNHGNPNYVELSGIAAYGKQLTTTPRQPVSGTYETNFGNLHIKQEGTSVSGCYENDGGLVVGGVEGAMMKFTWREGDQEGQNGPAIMVFTPDGKEMTGLYWKSADMKDRPSRWDGKKIADAVGECPNWKGSAESQLQSDLEKEGRARIYGINFDSDSDVIKPESKSTLDQIVAVLKNNAAWKMTIEGHTDSTSTPEHNRDLSNRRAEAVKKYLAGAGIDAARLSAVGFGADKPVAPNDTAAGRAQNRRVELAKS